MSDLNWEDLKIGPGPVIREGDLISVLYKVFASNCEEPGRILESNYSPDIPVSILYKEGQILDGLLLGMKGMRSGGGFKTWTQSFSTSLRISHHRCQATLKKNLVEKSKSASSRKIPSDRASNRLRNSRSELNSRVAVLMISIYILLDYDVEYMPLSLKSRRFYYVE